MSERGNELTTLDDSQAAAEEVQSDSEVSAMAQESPKNSAAEISVTTNGQLEASHEHNFNRGLEQRGIGSGPLISAAQFTFQGGLNCTKDLKHSLPVGLGLSETKITSHSSDNTKEGVIEAGPFQGSSASPKSSVISPSSAAASRLAGQGCDLIIPTGGRMQQKSGPVVLADEVKNPAMEKLELVRKWSLNTYKCTRQIISERLGRGSRTVDLELEAQIEILRDNKKKYENILKLAQTLSTQLYQMVHTQRQLGDAFADLSLKSLELHEEFGYNADTQKLLAKNGETLLGAINFFIASVNTLVNKTIEDTLLTVKQYESARIEYDAYRTDLEELNLGPRDANTLPKIEQSQQLFQMHKEKYDKMRNDVSIKLKFLEENKVKVLHNQLVLFHNAIAAYFAGNQKQLEQTLKQFHIKLKTPGVDAPSWLEEQ
ncbi:arfaptin-1 isoform X4 [Alligator mississippiensis]|uniref:arfaptin-1 isoform X4 n=2 Tax=Alligator mississippiensis TaxID=8496 RepID=UPI000906FD10|nr:arfaptin-1 isoform X4 [Alligator mississippiensis]XP_059577947.1 arfaptin-1 isoform X4 [Alligator mississippiensis]XP_059577948.1 arfaptin-1 isoform X4 [Alligator mississippiensis]XP_059577949.1 arfaptin-1 isoform X4 [Alligator mississippiensis]XP_059577950.1 arfaptin-1 isoform X4 [Alligator mississippiensis]XP_059577951.1 arfaptin-1 isoform X4 [Alligator mississippiensis]XP_059577952.1 arfaptin-1 isoform X4 [Alligator mississippiensis]